jgi:hypothetical protein
VRLVDHDQADRTVGDEGAQRLVQRLGRHVQQFELAAAEPPQRVRALRIAQRRVEDGRPKAEALQPVHLVLHQRDQRRQHQDRAAQQLGRDLERQRLAGSGRHHPDAVAAGQDGVDDLALARPERLVAEPLLEHLLRISARRQGHLHGGLNSTRDG